MPECFGGPVVDLLVCFLHLHARLWVRRAPGIPCALCKFGRRLLCIIRAQRVAGRRKSALFVSRAINVRTDAFSFTLPLPWRAGLSHMTLEGDGAPPHPERGRVGEGVNFD